MDKMEFLGRWTETLDGHAGKSSTPHCSVAHARSGGRRQIVKPFQSEIMASENYHKNRFFRIHYVNLFGGFCIYVCKFPVKMSRDERMSLY